jgi:hypothetical protein
MEKRLVWDGASSPGREETEEPMASKKKKKKM